MKRRREVGSDWVVVPQYLGQVDAAHVNASVAALRRLAGLVSVPAPESGGPVLRVQLAHYDHGAFLTLDLQAFSFLWSEDGGRLFGGGADAPTIFAIVINKPVEVQLAHALDMVATYVGRQELIDLRRRTHGDVDDLDEAVKDADRLAIEDAANRRRRGPWSEVAVAVGQRARAAGFGLEVTYAAPLADGDQVRLRGPVLRRVYNNSPAVRASVDRAVGAVARAFRIDSNGATAEVTEFVASELERGQVRQWIAQALRDAFVCGNGYLLLGGEAPARVLPPDETFSVADDRYVVRRGGTEESPAGHVLHMRGAHQVGSNYGLSQLEPFVMATAQVDVMRSGIEEMSRHDRAEARLWVERTQKTLARVVDEQDRRTLATLGSATAGFSAPASDLYFPGQQIMSPESGPLHYLERPDGL